MTVERMHVPGLIGSVPSPKDLRKDPPVDDTPLPFQQEPVFPG